MCVFRALLRTIKSDEEQSNKVNISISSKVYIHPKEKNAFPFKKSTKAKKALYTLPRYPKTAANQSTNQKDTTSHSSFSQDDKHSKKSTQLNADTKTS